MTLQEYQQQSKRTCPNLSDNLAVDLAHMVLGINTELSELEEAIEKKDKINIGEEIGDINWYVSNYCTFRSIDFNQLYHDSTSKPHSINALMTLYKTTSELQDLVKKNLAYKKEIPVGLEYYYLSVIIRATLQIMVQESLDIYKFLDNNISKLKIRFPEKFSETAANNRDLESERKQLEK